MAEQEKIKVNVRDDVFEVDAFASLVIYEREIEGKARISFAVMGAEGRLRQLIDDLLDGIVARMRESPEFEFAEAEQS